MTDPLADILSERREQDEKWGEQNHDDLYWFAILTEEIGELAKEIIEGKSVPHLREELIQVAAVSLAWLECLNRRSHEPT